MSAQAYAPRMIDLGSIGGLYERQRELHAYCHRCDRCRALDLEAMVRLGLGSKRLPLHVRCRVCGEPGQLQVRPPMPQWGNQTGWMSPPTGRC